MSAMTEIRPFFAAAFLLIAAVMPATAAEHADDGAMFSHGQNFDEQTGAALFANVCQDCHMAQGQGAIGAGRYPALAHNEKLEVSGYPLTVVLHGLNGMPAVGQMMSDQQVADVINYVRTHFGNAYPDALTPQDVAAAR
jgi:mono/diheme cytochrome c family protein